MNSSIFILILRSKQYYRVVTVCIFARIKVNCEVMHLHSFANFKSILSRHRKGLGGAPKARGLGHGLLGLCVNLSLVARILREI